jgi:Na+-translocating ferredoxin:NAD+ oxidoreductase RNF subunit RnfB
MLQNVLNALLAIIPICAVLGLALAFFSAKFAVAENEKAKKVRSALPGANCGACGFAGCDDYANAIAEGRAEPNLCVPGGAQAASEIGKLLGVEVAAPESVAAFVHCNGNCEATGKKAEYAGISSCRAAAMLYGGPGACAFSCIGLGDCAAVCPKNAICVKDGIAHVDKDLCIGCGACKNICPKNIISLVPRTAATAVMCSNKDKGADARKVCKNACIGCGKCVRTCKNGAITVENNLARIDYSKCTACGECASACPTGCLKNVDFSEAKIKETKNII